MKQLIVLALLLITLHTNAQKGYIQAGGGYQFRGHYSRQSGTAELNGGIKFSQIVYVGVGATYLEFSYKGPYVPIYVDFKVMAKGTFRPYIFLQAGYAFYKGFSVYDDYGNYAGNVSGGFYSNAGIGVSYKRAYAQFGYRNMNIKYPGYGTEGYGAVAVTAGVAIF